MRFPEMPAGRGYFLAGVGTGAALVVGLMLAYSRVVPGGSVDSTLHPGQRQAEILRDAQAPVIHVSNTDFMLTPSISAWIDFLDGRLVSKGPSPAIDIDDATSFSVEIDGARVGLHRTVLETVFNDGVFAYPDAPLRNLHIRFVNVAKDGKPIGHIELNGEIRYVTWMSFTQVGRVEIDRERNVLVMKMESVTLLGHIPSLALLQRSPLTLESILKLPPDRGVSIRGNDILLFPFHLFPPPTLNGRLSNVEIDVVGQRFILSFGEKVVRPVSFRNSIRLSKGTLKFGRLVMTPTDVLVLDADERDPLVFQLPQYARHVSRGTVRIGPDHAVVATGPDFNDLPP